MKRRQFNQLLLGTPLVAGSIGRTAFSSDSGVEPVSLENNQFLKTIPVSGEQLPAVGMGTWITFDVPPRTKPLDQRTEVLRRFYKAGGAMLDSSPMYGYAEQILGHCLTRLNHPEQTFSASKIWTPVDNQGPLQMQTTENLWTVKQMDLMFVHNRVNWKTQLPQLREWKDSGRIRYTGVSTSHGRRHEKLEQLFKQEEMDFVQLTYNMVDRDTEERLIPMAADHGIAVVANRPFKRGQLIKQFDKRPLPGLATELGCSTWAQYLLLFVVSHPQITVAIPATSQPEHMDENMAVMQMEMPDAATRKAMLKTI